MKLDVVVSSLRIESDKEHPFYPDDYYIQAVFNRALKLKVPDLASNENIQLLEKYTFNRFDDIAMSLSLNDKEAIERFYKSFVSGEVITIEF